MHLPDGSKGVKGATSYYAQAFGWQRSENVDFGHDLLAISDCLMVMTNRKHLRRWKALSYYVFAFCVAQYRAEPERQESSFSANLLGLKIKLDEEKVNLPETTFAENFITFLMTYKA